MLALAVSLPQCAKTQTPRMSSLSAPENPLPNAVLSGKKTDAQRSMQSTTVYTWLLQQRRGQRQEGTAVSQGMGARWCVLHPQERARALSQGSVSLDSAPLSPPSKPVTPSLPDPLRQLDSKGDSRCTESKLQTPHVQHVLVARPLQC